MTAHTRKMQTHVEDPEALKKALERARDEKARLFAHRPVEALTAVNKKAFKVKHVRRT